MSIQILDRTIGGIGDQRLSLGNAEGRREISIGSDWTKIRIGYRHSLFQSIDADFGGTPRLWLGMLDATDDGLNDPGASVHFAGIRSTQGTWNYVAGPPKHYSSTQFKVTKKEALTVTEAASNIQSPVVSADPTTAAFAIFLEMTKGSPWTFQVCSQSTSTVTHLTLETFVQMMEAGTLADIVTIQAGYSASATDTMAIDEVTNGNLIAITMFWDRASATMEFSDVAWRKIS